MNSRESKSEPAPIKGDVVPKPPRAVHIGPRQIELQQLNMARILSREQQQHYPNINPDAMTYEQLLELEESIGNVSKGLNTARIKVVKLLIV